MTLAKLQTDFSDYLLDRPNSIEAAIQGDITVYHHAYRAQLLSCLRDTFEKSWAWLGDERFEAAAAAHIAAHPPHSWTLNLYGEGFETTLAGLYPDDPEIGDLAWLEWSLRRAFDGADADPADPAGLAAVDWDNAVLFFVPTLSIGPVTSNCAAIWTALAEDLAPPAAEPLPEPSVIRIWRKGLSAHFRSIGRTEERALRLAMSGVNFSEICSILVAEQGDGDATADIGRVLGTWLQDGMIAAIQDHAGDSQPMSSAEA
jgi:hypothetical protein